ncbi:hypothetical protein IQ06DRAFT_371848 [Phaeosphaeriaceae sp. SRC1lsM3a]|nr:hypothetical protein IQ06DRAFT_371848 [Stagonospora sp. SRC1lsM3a]
MNPSDAAVECDYKANAPPPDAFDTLVSVYVGQRPITKEFQVHHGILCHHSRVIENMLKDSANNDISFPEHEPAVFNIMLYWMYTGRFWALDGSRDSEAPLSFQQALSMYFFPTEQHGTSTERDYDLVLSPIGGGGSHSNDRGRRDDLRAHKVLSSEFLTDVLERLEEFNQPPGACHFDAVWIEKMNKHFCSLYHNHGTKDSGDDADDSDGPDDTSRTVGRPDEAGSDDFKEESSPPLSPVASYYVQNVELDGMWTFGVLGPAVAYQDCGNTSSDDSDLGS